jgi:hypothetical protein
MVLERRTGWVGWGGGGEKRKKKRGKKIGGGADAILGSAF